MVLVSSVRCPAGLTQSGTGPSIATVASLPLSANVYVVCTPTPAARKPTCEPRSNAHDSSRASTLGQSRWIPMRTRPDAV